MLTRIINGILLLIIFGGVAAFAYRSYAVANLREEHSRLARQYGALEVKDPSKYMVMMIPSDDPLNFMWRFYYPANLKIEEQTGFGVINSSGNWQYSSSGEHFNYCNFRLAEGRVVVSTKNRGGGGRRGRSDPELTAFLKANWDQLEIQQLASNGTVEISTDDPVCLLTITIPMELNDELIEYVGEKQAAHLLSAPFFQMKLGTTAALQKPKSKQVKTNGQ